MWQELVGERGISIRTGKGSFCLWLSRDEILPESTTYAQGGELSGNALLWPFGVQYEPFIRK